MLNQSPVATQAFQTSLETLASFFNAFTKKLAEDGVSPSLINRAIKKAMPDMPWAKKEDPPAPKEPQQSGYGQSFVKYVASTGLKVLPNVASKQFTEKSITKLAAGFVGGGIAVQLATEIAVDSVLDIGSYIISYRAKQDNRVLVKSFDAKICAYFVEAPDVSPADEPIEQLDTEQSRTINIDHDKLKQALNNCLNNLLMEGVPYKGIITCASAAKHEINGPIKSLLGDIIDLKANDWHTTQPKKRKQDKDSKNYYGTLAKTGITTSLKFVAKKVRKKLRKEGVIDVVVSFVPFGTPAKFVTELAIEAVGDFSQSFVTTYSNQQKRDLTQKIGSSILVNFNCYRSKDKDNASEQKHNDAKIAEELPQNDQTQPPSQRPVYTPQL